MGAERSVRIQEIFRKQKWQDLIIDDSLEKKTLYAQSDLSYPPPYLPPFFSSFLVFKNTTSRGLEEHYCISQSPWFSPKNYFSEGLLSTNWYSYLFLPFVALIEYCSLLWFLCIKDTIEKWTLLFLSPYLLILRHIILKKKTRFSSS